MKDQAQLLIDILLDKTAREDERDDAAIDLRKYKDCRVLNALTKIASDSDEDDVIVENCAESIGIICVAMNQFDENSYQKITPFAKKILFNIILAYNAELLSTSLKEKLNKGFK
jgi:hypothetical protein